MGFALAAISLQSDSVATHFWEGVSSVTSGANSISEGWRSKLFEFISKNCYLVNYYEGRMMALVFMIMTGRCVRCRVSEGQNTLLLLRLFQ
mmetsp:Transcript_9043/g.13476  ORF Transcript_9043/g.13476 Transcript_9043/m.13476 type:complete len:91 (-) Transcript_9043:4-276(-)